ncbi:hypothetical protein FOA52_003692 [Chlamydomonas sp. UWO 241]|nr:hypothetical protein FOA52_003692 [Chlamydomonas sp. UWO 241]
MAEATVVAGASRNTHFGQPKLLVGVEVLRLIDVTELRCEAPRYMQRVHKHTMHLEGLLDFERVMVEEEKRAGKRSREEEGQGAAAAEGEGEGVVEDHMGVGYITLQWREMSSHEGFNCPTFERLAELAIVMVPVSVEDEQLFSALNFIKSKAHNRLHHPHLTDALRLFFSNTFEVLTFPYTEALKASKEAAAVRERYKKKFT